MEQDVEDFKNDMLKNINMLEKDRNHTRNLVQCINEMEIFKQEFSDLLSSESESEIDYESLDELDLPMSSLSKDDQGINEAKQTQHFKTGIYAHWWMKANLQQPEEEPSLPKGHLGTWI